MNRVNNCNFKLNTIGKLSYCSACENCCLGKGSYGVVFRGKYQTKVDVAVKRVDKLTRQVELEVLRKVEGHPNILKLYHTEENYEFWYIATELCLGTLTDIVIKEKYNGPPFGSNRRILRQIVSGVVHLHANKIIHRDLKPENILFSISDYDGHPVMKLADFGLSRIVSEDASHLSRTQTDGYSPVLRPFGTDGWIAPEVLNDERTYTQSADIFPLGLIFAFTLSRRRHPYDVDPPKDDETKEEAEKRIISRNNRIKLKMPMTLTVEQLNNDDHKAFELIRRMLLADAKKRPTAVQVLEHNFFQRDPQKAIQLLKLCQHATLNDEASVQFTALVMDEESVDVNCTDLDRNTPLVLLCRNHKSDSLDHYVEILFRRPDIEADKVNQKESNALMKLCANYNGENIVKVAEMLIAKGTDINYVNRRGANAFIILCSKSTNSNILQVFDLLISKGINIHHQDKNDHSAFTKLCRYSKSDQILKMSQRLINKGFDLKQTSNKYGDSSLMELCRYSTSDKLVQMTQLLVSKLGDDINQINNNGDNALMYLCRYSPHRESVLNTAQLLIASHRIDVNQINKSGKNALMQLCKYSTNDDIDQVVKLLVSKGVNVHQLNEKGENALMLLCRCCSIESEKIVKVAESLIKKGVNVNHTSNYMGTTP